MLRKRRPQQEVTVGSIYRRDHHFNVIEQVEVVSIDHDDAGIPHVCFDVTHLRPYGNEKQGTRVLAMAAFSERYQMGQAAPAA